MSRSLTTAYNSGDSSASRAKVLSSQPPVHNSTGLTTPELDCRFSTDWVKSQSQSHSHIATDGRSVSQSVSLGVEPHLGLMARYLLLFDSYGLVFCGAPSLTRRRVCHLYMLLTLASAVFPYFTIFFFFI
jgi:hypothetical protein